MLRSLQVTADVTPELNIGPAIYTQYSLMCFTEMHLLISIYRLPINIRLLDY